MRIRVRCTTTSAPATTYGVCALIGEVFIEGDNDGVMPLSPAEQLLVCRSAQADLDGVQHFPATPPLLQPPDDCPRHVLIEQDRRSVIEAG
jgi:hypothetical protein